MDSSVDYYKDQLYKFIAIRKHFFSDVHYFVYITKTHIIMSQKDQSPRPKYIIPLSLSTNLGFSRKKSRSLLILETIYFVYKNNIKHFHAATGNLLIAMNLITNLVTFSQINDFYDPNFIIGKGASSNVLSVKDIFTQQDFAVKSIDKNYLYKTEKALDAFKTEVSILMELTNENIPQKQYFIKLYSVYEDRQTFKLVMDLMKGKSLQVLLRKMNKHAENGRLPSDKPKIIFKKILEAVHIMHTKNIIHRDLKPGNILLEKKDVYETIVIGDFGLSTRQNIDQYLFPRGGTPGYMAPEIIMLKDKSLKYSEVCDIFSCGCIFYELLTGKPLLFPNSPDYLQKIYKNDYLGALKDNKIIPEDAMQLLLRLLEHKPEKRISANEALQSKYFAEKQTKSPEIQIHQSKLYSQKVILVKSSDLNIQTPMQNHGQTHSNRSDQLKVNKNNTLEEVQPQQNQFGNKNELTLQVSPQIKKENQFISDLELIQQKQSGNQQQQQKQNVSIGQSSEETKKNDLIIKNKSQSSNNSPPKRPYYTQNQLQKLEK